MANLRCKGCKYYVKSIYLNCTVHPSQDEFNDPDCKDWEARSPEQDVPFWERQQPIDSAHWTTNESTAQRMYQRYDRTSRADAVSRILDEQRYRRSARCDVGGTDEEGFVINSTETRPGVFFSLANRSAQAFLPVDREWQSGDYLIGQVVIPQDSLRVGDTIEISLTTGTARKVQSPKPSLNGFLG